jgi:hypothetical protein
MVTPRAQYICLSSRDYQPFKLAPLLLLSLFATNISLFKPVSPFSNDGSGVGRGRRVLGRFGLRSDMSHL